MTLTSRIALWLIVAGLVTAIVVALRAAPVAVDGAVAIVGPLTEDVVEDGRARVRDNYTVAAPAAGTLPRITLREGDSVEQGTVLARLMPLSSTLLDPRTREVAEQQLAAAEAAEQQASTAVESSTENAKQAKRDLDRMRVLKDNGAISAAALDSVALRSRTAASDVDAARFAEQAAAHTVEQARAALQMVRQPGTATDHIDVTSPVAGRILHVLQQSAGVVAAGAPLVEIGNVHGLELVVDVLSQDAVDIRPRMPARVLNWGGDHPLTATVRRIEPAAFTHTSALGVDEQRVNVILDLDGAPSQWAGLGDGFAAEIDITTWSRPDALQVPSSALFREGNGWALFVVEKGRAALRHVQVGHQGPLQSEILGGIVAGAMVVTHPGSAVTNDTRVTVSTRS